MSERWGEKEEESEEKKEGKERKGQGDTFASVPGCQPGRTASFPRLSFSRWDSTGDHPLLR